MDLELKLSKHKLMTAAGNSAPNLERIRTEKRADTINSMISPGSKPKCILIGGKKSMFNCMNNWVFIAPTIWGNTKWVKFVSCHKLKNTKVGRVFKLKVSHSNVSVLLHRASTFREIMLDLEFVKLQLNVWKCSMQMQFTNCNRDLYIVDLLPVKKYRRKISIK